MNKQYPTNIPAQNINPSPIRVWGVFQPFIPKVKHNPKIKTKLNNNAKIFLLLTVFAFSFLKDSLSGDLLKNRGGSIMYTPTQAKYPEHAINTSPISVWGVNQP
ncbi:MAG TPA: hypothetical protein VFC92_01590 [Bacteroidales bacterium]|nr:hypothetical protein [Bacteroidales bacterium]